MKVLNVNNVCMKEVITDVISKYENKDETDWEWCVDVRYNQDRSSIEEVELSTKWLCEDGDSYSEHCSIYEDVFYFKDRDCEMSVGLVDMMKDIQIAIKTYNAILRNLLDNQDEDSIKFNQMSKEVEKRVLQYEKDSCNMVIVDIKDINKVEIYSNTGFNPKEHIMTITSNDVYITTCIYKSEYAMGMVMDIQNILDEYDF